MQANNGFLSYWRLLGRTSSFKNPTSVLSRILRFLQIGIRLLLLILKDAGIELIFLVAFWLIITKMSQGRDLIVSLFEPKGIYSGWRIFYTVLSAIGLSISMWIIPAFLFEIRDRRNKSKKISKTAFEEHLFFAHRILALIPFWLLASVLFKQVTTAFLFAVFSIIELGLLYLINYILPRHLRPKIIVGAVVVLLGAILMFALNYRETYTASKVWLAVILYLIAFLMHCLYNEADQRIIRTVKSPVENKNSFEKHAFNSWIYLVVLLMHVILLTWLFIDQRPVLAPESIMLYIFSAYVFVIDLIVYLINIDKKVKLITVSCLVLLLMLLFLLPQMHLNMKHYALDPINGKSNLDGLERLSFEERYSRLRQEINANKSGEPYPIILVSGEGGGSRAGMWFSQNLINFDYYTRGHFRKHIFSLSTVSGSTVGLSTLFSFWEFADRQQLDSVDSRWIELPSKVYANNFVGGSVTGMLLTDFWKSFFPGNLVRDRNSMLEDEEAYQTQRACLSIMKGKEISPYENIPRDQWLLAKDFMNFFYDRKGDSLSFKDRPLVFINSCRSNDGRRGIISPVKLSSDVFNDAIDIAGYLYDSTICDSYGNLCRGKKQNISLGQACNLSELFPLFSAPAYINSLGSFVDGGYHENSGLKTTLDVYSKLQSTLKSDTLEGKYVIYILYFKNSSGEKNLYKPLESELPITLPLKALSSQPFQGSASYFEEKARYVDLNQANTRFFRIQLDNRLILDKEIIASTADDPALRKMEQEILNDLRSVKEDSVLNFPLARWLSRSVIERIRLAAFPLRPNRSREDSEFLKLLALINRMHLVSKVSLKPYEPWSPNAKLLLRQQTEINTSVEAMY